MGGHLGRVYRRGGIGRSDAWGRRRKTLEVIISRFQLRSYARPNVRVAPELTNGSASLILGHYQIRGVDKSPFRRYKKIGLRLEWVLRLECSQPEPERSKARAAACRRKPLRGVFPRANLDSVEP